jgi:Histidine kinase-, DNA gyrase B-, and HSP90-like ATPase
MPQATDLRPPFIGSYVLETLTTGMYGESKNALREYVQNSFDAIRSSVAAGLMTADSGRIDVLLPDKDTLIIRDNGVGIGTSSAWGTLTAIGASKKDRRIDAGFRGIGRLAGIAFCDRLTFRTKAAGETTETNVEFDCRALRHGMSPESGGEELVELLKRSVSATTGNGLKASDHYMVVSLQGLASAPQDFKNLDDIRRYLAETSPVAFEPDWEFGKKIEGEGEKRKSALEHVLLFVGHTEDTMKPIFKRYKSTYDTSQGPANIESIQFYSGPDGAWWGWAGIPDRPGTLKDRVTHGLRFRVKNIQVGDTTIWDRLFARKNESYGRFNRYYIGEVHIRPDLLIPNARRDGFEENEEWNRVQASLLKTVCTPLTKRAYALSEGRKNQLEAVQRRVEDLVGVSEPLVQSGNVQEEQKVQVLYKVLRIRTQIANALKQADPETRLELKSHLDVLDSIRRQFGGADDQREKIREELLTQVLEIIQPYLDPSSFAKVRKLLKEKIR